MDLDEVLAELLAVRRAAGQDATLQYVGAALRKKLGSELYEEYFGGGLKSTLAARPGWYLAEARPSVYVLHPQDRSDS